MAGSFGGGGVGPLRILRELWNRIFPTGSRIVSEIHFQDGVCQISGADV